MSRRLHAVAQPLRLGQRLELLERVVLDLADALARDVERPPDLLQRARPRRPSRPKRISMTSRSRWGSAASARCTFSLRRFSEATSNGDSAASSSTKSPSSDSSSSPIGFSSEIGCWAHAQDVAHLAHARTRARSAISSGVGSRPSCWTSWRSTWTTLLSFSTMWTGMRIVRPLSAIARVTAWRIHHVA